MRPGLRTIWLRRLEERTAELLDRLERCSASAQAEFHDQQYAFSDSAIPMLSRRKTAVICRRIKRYKNTVLVAIKELSYWKHHAPSDSFHIGQDFSLLRGILFC
jgi:hypothetical protein